MNLAIIGLGLSGASLLRGLIENKNYNDDINIDIFEKRKDLVVGMAYEEDSLTALLNYNAIDMSVKSDDKYDFINRLSEKGYKKDEREDMVPRLYYGRYLKDRFNPYYDHKNVKIYNENIIDIDILSTKHSYIYKYKVTSDKAKHDTVYDAIFLCIGNSYYKDNYNLSNAKNYIDNPYPLDKKLSEIKDNSSIAVLGSSASATDMFRYLMKKRKLQKPIYFFTLKEEYKIVDIPYKGDRENIISLNNEWIREEKDKNNGFIPLKNIFSKIREDFSKYGYSRKEVYERYKNSTLNDSRNALDRNDQELAFTERYFMEIALLIADLLNSLKGLEKEEYLEKYHTMFTFFSGKTPENTMKRILESSDNHDIKIIKNIKDVVENEDNTFTIFADKNKTVDYVINATGFETTLIEATENIALLKSLVNKNLLLSGKLGKTVLVTWPKCNLINQKYGIMENIFMTGMRISDTDIDNNDNRVIQKTSAYIARYFMENYKKYEE